MKQLIHLLLVAVFILPAHLSADDKEQPYRTWDSLVGTSIQAQLIKVNSDDSVTLQGKDGSTLRVKQGQLSIKDQRYLEELAALEGRPDRILFIGNSYTGQIRGMVTKFVAASPYKECRIDFISPGGRTLEKHFENDATMAKIRDVNWDVVVLQDQSQTPAIFPEKFMDAARKIDRIIDDVGAKTVFYETWGRRDGDKQNAHLFPTYKSMQKALSNSYKIAARKCDAQVAPVGQAWAVLRKDNPELGEKLYKGDGSHPAAPGAYLAACVLYATLFDADPTTVEFDGGLPEEQVRAIHVAVLKVVE